VPKSKNSFKSENQKSQDHHDSWGSSLSFDFSENSEVENKDEENNEDFIEEIIEEKTEDKNSKEVVTITEATKLEFSVNQMSTPPENETVSVSLMDISNTIDETPIPLNPALKFDQESSADSADDNFSGDGPIYVEVVTDATQDVTESVTEKYTEEMVTEGSVDISHMTEDDSGSGDIESSGLSQLEASTFEGSSDFSGSGGSPLDIEVDFKGPRPSYSITTQGTTVTTTSTATTSATTTTTSATTTTTTTTTTTSAIQTTTTSIIKATSTTHLPVKGSSLYKGLYGRWDMDHHMDYHMVHIIWTN